jgi:hypothetical protein
MPRTPEEREKDRLRQQERYKDPEKRARRQELQRALYARKREAMRLKRRADYAANKEQHRVKSHESYLKHRDKRLAERKAYVEANKEAVAATLHANYLAHQAERLAYAKAWKAANPTYNRDWLRATPGKGSAYTRKYTMRKLGLPHVFSPEEESFCRAYFQYACAICGKEEGFQWRIVMDHWIPLTAEDCPGTIATNMIPLCHGNEGCNNSKRNKDPEIWLIARFGPRKARQILARIRAYFAVVIERQA